MALTPREVSVSPPCKPRSRRKKLLLGLGAIFGLVGLWLTISYLRGNSALGKAIAEADRLDPGWQIDELIAKRAVVPDARNSALVIMAGERLSKKTNSSQLLAQEDEVDELRRFPANRPNAAQLEAIQALLASYEKAMPEYRKLADMPDGRFPLTLSPDMIGTLLKCQCARDCVRPLQLEAYQRLEAGDSAGAANRLLACLNSARSLGDEPFAISMLVRIAIDAVTLTAFQRFLGQAEADDATLAMLQKALEREEAEPLLLICARGERAMGFGCLQYFKGKPSAAGMLSGTGTSNWLDSLMFVMPGLVDLQQAALLQYMNRYVEIAKLPISQQREALATWESGAKQLPRLASLLAPALSKMAGAYWRSRAQLRCMILALAAERYRLAKNQWPDSLDDLVKTGFLSNMPNDPFNGKQFIWKPTPDGRIIYSVGQNLKDDGGIIDSEKLAMADSDIGYWLFDPSKRRQLPRPPNPPATSTDAP